MFELVTSAQAQEQPVPVPAPVPAPAPAPLPQVTPAPVPAARHAAPAPHAAPAASAAEHGAEHDPTEGSAESQVSHEVQESVGHAGDEHGAFPPFDPSTYGSQLIWLAITFGFLYWLMSKVALPRIGGILEERDTRIASDLAAAEKLRGESDAAQAAYEQALAEARQGSQAIALEARNRSKADTDAERARLEEQVNTRMLEAETRIAAVKDRALGDVDVIARDTAEALVQALLGPQASSGEVAAAVSAVKAEGRA